MTTGPEVIAHRGANREAPENTLEAFELAVAAGAGGIELDVQFTQDGVPVVHHDPRLPATGGGGLLGSMTLDEVQRRANVPTLSTVLDLVRARCRLYVEVKAPEAISSVVRLLEPHRSWCAVHSFDHRTIRRASELDRSLGRGILLVSYLVDTVSALRAARARDLWQHADYVDQSLVGDVHREGGRVIAWTVNDPDRAQELAAMGVAGICTDVPRAMLTALR